MLDSVRSKRSNRLKEQLTDRSPYREEKIGSARGESTERGSVAKTRVSDGTGILRAFQSIL
jgi:hypothetical protein